MGSEMCIRDRISGITGSFAVRGRRAVLQALLAPDESVSAPVGDAPELNRPGSDGGSDPTEGCRACQHHGSTPTSSANVLRG